MVLNAAFSILVYFTTAESVEKQYSRCIIQHLAAVSTMHVLGAIQICKLGDAPADRWLVFKTQKGCR